MMSGNVSISLCAPNYRSELTATPNAFNADKWTVSDTVSYLICRIKLTTAAKVSLKMKDLIDALGESRGKFMRLLKSTGLARTERVHVLKCVEEVQSFVHDTRLLEKFMWKGHKGEFVERAAIEQ